jgi:hypothetical protein
MYKPFHKMTNAEKMAHNRQMNQLISVRVNDSETVKKYVACLKGKKS